MHADGEVEGLVEGQEVWEELMGQSVEGTDWRRRAKEEWRAMGEATTRTSWATKEC